MTREELIVIMRRIWLNNPLFDRKYNEKPTEETKMFVSFADDVTWDMPDEFSEEEAYEMLQNVRKPLREEKRTLVWNVVFDAMIEEIIDSMAALCSTPPEKRPSAIIGDTGPENCVICGEPLQYSRNDPAPVADFGCCCKSCERRYVTPVKMIVWKDESERGGGVKNLMKNLFGGGQQEY